MPLWGTNTSDESRPKWLRPEDLPGNDYNTCFADERGWVIVHPNGMEEVIACVGGLSTSLGNATIVNVYFGKRTYGTSAAGTVIVNYNEAVTVTSGATLSVTASGVGGVSTITATAGAQTDVNKVVFDFTTTVSGSTLSLAGQTISGTIVDYGTSTASDKTFINTEIAGAGGRGSTLTATVS